MLNFGDLLFEKVAACRSTLFALGEITQLAYQSHVYYIDSIKKLEEDVIVFSMPVGFNIDNDKTLDSDKHYSKESLIERYLFIADHQLALSGIYQLVTSIESMFNSILKESFLQYPGQIKNKNKIDFEQVLNAGSVEEIKLFAINAVLNELAYKSPKEFADEFEKYMGVRLLEIPSYHRYLELKATRDIYIHNNGIINETYLSKSGHEARGKSGDLLTINPRYFLKSYETCLQITESLDKSLHSKWPSANYIKSLEAVKDQSVADQQDIAIERAMDLASESNVGGGNQFHESEEE